MTLLRDDPVALRDVRMRLPELYSNSEAELWLASPQKLLGGKRPLDCEPCEVLQVIRAIMDGVYL